MWFFEMRYRKGCMLGGHFYSREEMYEWFSNMLKYYTFHDEFYDLHIWYDDKYYEEEY